MISYIISIIWLFFTIGIFIIGKILYTRYRKWWLMPIISVPVILIILISLFNANFLLFKSFNQWLSWMLGPATVSFAVPIYEKRKIIYRHWPILCIGVITGVVISVISSIFLAKIFGLSPEVQASLATRSISTPFALMVAPKVGGSTDLAAIFVVLTGVFGMVIGELMLLFLPIRSRLAKGSLFGAAAHVCGTTKAMEIHQEIGVVSSLVMILSGIVTVFLYPLVSYLLKNF